MAHLWAKSLRHPCPLGDLHCCRGGAKSEVANEWASWLHHPFPLGDPHLFRAGGKIRSGPLVGKVTTSPLRFRGCPALQRGCKIRSGPKVGNSATSAPASRESPLLESRVQNQKWPKWLCHPCRLGDLHRCRAEVKIRTGPLVGEVATSPLPSRGSPPLQSGKKKHEVADLWAKCLRHPCPSLGSSALQRGGKIRSCPQVGNPAMSVHASRGSPLLQSRGQDQKWPTCGQSG